MSQQPPLFDPNLNALRRERAQKLEDVDFLAKETASILKERLEEVNKSFTDIAIVTDDKGFWSGAFSSASIVAADETLELSPESCDLVMHLLLGHRTNDLVGQLIQVRRALRPDGMMICVLLGGQTLAELRASLAQAEIDVRGGLSPRVAPMAEIRDLGGLIQRAGLALPVADGVTLTATYASPLHLMRELRAMGETNIMSAQDRGFLRRDVLGRACDIYQNAYGTEDGRVPATFELIFLTGWAPSDVQQKPLRPGTAKTRLADALETKEHPAGDRVDGI